MKEWKKDPVTEEISFRIIILSYYAVICSEEKIEFNAKLIVPEMAKTSLNNDLSIVFGNLLENAIEACLKIDKDKRFIKINSDVS